MTISADAVLSAIIALAVALLTGAFILTRELASVNARVSDLANAFGHMNESIDLRLRSALLEQQRESDKDSATGDRDFKRALEMDLVQHFAQFRQEIRREFVDRPEFGAHLERIGERVAALERRP